MLYYHFVFIFWEAWEHSRTKSGGKNVDIVYNGELRDTIEFTPRASWVYTDSMVRLHNEKRRRDRLEYRLGYWVTSRKKRIDWHGFRRQFDRGSWKLEKSSSRLRQMVKSIVHNSGNNFYRVCQLKKKTIYFSFLIPIILSFFKL